MSDIRTSEQLNEIAGALAKAQAGMENVAKDRENPHFRSRYTTLAGVLDEVRPKLAQQGISIFQAPVNGEGNTIGVVTRLLHSSGQWIEAAFYVAPTKFDAQGAGSAITYCRRYSLMAVAGVGPEDDDGNAAIEKPMASATRAGPVRASERDADPFSQSPAPRTSPQAPTSAHLPASPEEPPAVTAARIADRAAFWSRESYAIDPKAIHGGITRWDAEYLAQAEAATHLDALLKLKSDNKEAGFVSAWENNVATPVIKHFRQRVRALEKLQEERVAA